MTSYFEYIKNFTTPVNENKKSLDKFYKMATLDKAMSLKIDNPKLTKKEVAKSLSISERTLQRYSNDINESMFAKKKIKTKFNPQKCEHCEFISKNKAGLMAHERSKHLELLTKKIAEEKNERSSKESVSIQKVENKKTKVDKIKKGKIKEIIGNGEFNLDEELDKV